MNKKINDVYVSLLILKTLINKKHALDHVLVVKYDKCLLLKTLK